MSRYVIIGAGAVGATLAAELHQAGRSVVLIARGEHLAALREHGLRYLRPDGAHVLDIPVAAGPDEVDLQSGDVLVVAGKSQHTERIIADWAWRPVKTEDGTTIAAASALPVVMLQNGLESERAALRRFSTVHGAVTWVPSSYLQPGEIASPGAPLVAVAWIGAYPSGRPAELEVLAADLRAARFAVQTVPDIQRWKVGKLLGNLINAFDALYAPSALRDIATDVVRLEATRVLAAAGLDAADLTTESHLDLSTFAVHAVAGRDRPGSSTWQSLARGAGVETDFLNGEIVLIARLAGRDAPYNRLLTARSHRAAAEGQTPGALTDADLRADLPGVERARVLVDADQLRRELEAARPPVVLDVRWALGDLEGEKHYLAGHVPGARFVDLDHELAGPAEALAGRHPLPDIEHLQSAARRWGISSTSSVVVYDNSGALAAGRAWWLLRWAGVADVRILDGGLAAWTAAGGTLQTGPARDAEAGDVGLSAGHLPVLTADEAARWADTGVLLDARAPERYRGEVEPIDPRAGHIPGAVSAPTGENIDADARFRPTAQLRARFAEAGVDGAAPVAVYCGSGVTAAHQIAALAAAGFDAALFPGSWSAWSSDPQRPVATGPDPKERQ